MKPLDFLNLPSETMCIMSPPPNLVQTLGPHLLLTTSAQLTTLVRAGPDPEIKTMPLPLSAAEAGPIRLLILLPGLTLIQV